MRTVRSVALAIAAASLLSACSAQPDPERVAAGDPRPTSETPAPESAVSGTAASETAAPEIGVSETEAPPTSPTGSASASDPVGAADDADPEGGGSDPVPPSRVETSTGPPRGEIEVGGGAAEADVEARVGEILADFGAVEVGADTVLTVPEQVLFDFDSAALRPDAASALDAVVEVLDFEADSPVEVRGHTDSRGGDDYNQRLSEARAEAVRAYFEQRAVDPGRLRAVGLGETMPVAPNEGPDGADDPEGRQANRRVEVVVEGTSG